MGYYSSHKERDKAFNIAEYITCLLYVHLIQSHLQSEDTAGVERERDVDRFGGGQHILRGLDSIGEGSLLRAIYRGKMLETIY